MDGNETTWLDEGMAQLAETVLGLDSVDTYHDWLDATEIQLNRWEYEDDGEVFAHYGGAYLFMVYFWEQLGDQAVIDLSHHPANGTQAITAVLAQHRPNMTFADFWADWVTAVWWDGDDAGNLYEFDHLRLREPDTKRLLRRTPTNFTEEILPFGVHYIELGMSGDVTVNFAGNSIASLTPPSPTDDLFWLAPSIDNLSASLTAPF